MDLKWKKLLSELLKKLGFLDDNTEQIVINCHKGDVSDVKPTMRYK